MNIDEVVLDISRGDLTAPQLHGIIPSRRYTPMSTSAAQKRANAKYDAANTTQIKLKLNLTTDADILAWLDEMALRDSVRGKQGYIKALIRRDMDEHAQK